jgi:hypothetical protein
MSYTIFLLEITIYFCFNFEILFDLIYNCFHQSYDLLIASSKPVRTYESRDRLSVFSKRYSGIRDIYISLYVAPIQWICLKDCLYIIENTK